MIVCYSAEQIDAVWDEIKPHIQRALDRGSNYHIDDIFEGLCNRSMQVWCWKPKDIEAAVITTIQEKDDIKFCLFLAMGGSGLKDWKDGIAVIYEWAKGLGCTEMRIYGRAGWGRQFGFETVYTKMIKRI